ncbi:hypothetical protein EB796_005623 [Bugula neritina]|uniref:WSC domain-containing protein n=1 Tax=Bugula neritina TaxID=10212 RepID=A0A7J7KBQ9_BUGNE|nr:hypothetical protein EB796_005623 [Bugula neritina]
MYECFCGNDGLGKNGGIAPEVTCNTPCQGDPTQTCGGGHRLSVYELSPLKKRTEEVFLFLEGNISNLKVMSTRQNQIQGQCTLACLNDFFCKGYTYDRAEGTCKHLERTCSSASITMTQVYLVKSQFSQNYCSK